MKDMFYTYIERNTPMCDLVKSVDNGDDTLTSIDKCLMHLDKLAYQCHLEKLTIGNEDV